MERHVYQRTVLSVSKYYKNQTQRVCVLPSVHDHHHYHQNVTCSYHEIAEKMCPFHSFVHSFVRPFVHSSAPLLVDNATPRRFFVGVMGLLHYHAFSI
jgi:hypothetical protein